MSAPSPPGKHVPRRSNASPSQSPLFQAGVYLPADRVPSLRATLECPLCLETFRHDAQDRAPMLLQCFHTFCSLCVTKLENDGSVRCPTCRGVCDFAHTGKNFSLVEVLETLAVAVSKATDADAAPDCCAKGCSSVADVYCSECRSFYCANHSGRVHEFRNCDAGSIGPPVCSQRPRCSVHRAEELTLFCFEDNQVLCVLCARSPSHVPHKVMPIAQAVALARQELQHARDAVQAKADKLHKSALCANEAVETTVREAVEHVRQWSKTQYERIDRFKSTLTKNIEAAGRAAVDPTSAARVNAAQQCARMLAAANEADTVVQQGITDDALLQAFGPLKHRLSGYSNAAPPGLGVAELLWANKLSNVSLPTLSSLVLPCAVEGGGADHTWMQHISWTCTVRHDTSKEARSFTWSARGCREIALDLDDNAWIVDDSGLRVINHDGDLLFYLKPTRTSVRPKRIVLHPTDPHAIVLCEEAKFGGGTLGTLWLVHADGTEKALIRVHQASDIGICSDGTIVTNDGQGVRSWTMMEGGSLAGGKVLSNTCGDIDIDASDNIWVCGTTGFARKHIIITPHGVIPMPVRGPVCFGRTSVYTVGSDGVSRHTLKRASSSGFEASKVMAYRASKVSVCERRRDGALLVGSERGLSLYSHDGAKLRTIAIAPEGGHGSNSGFGSSSKTFGGFSKLSFGSGGGNRGGS